MPEDILDIFFHPIVLVNINILWKWNKINCVWPLFVVCPIYSNYIVIKQQTTNSFSMFKWRKKKSFDVFFSIWLVCLRDSSTFVSQTHTQTTYGLLLLLLDSFFCSIINSWQSTMDMMMMELKFSSFLGFFCEFSIFSQFWLFLWCQSCHAIMITSVFFWKKKQ